MVDHLAEGLKSPIVHIRSGQRNIPQTGRGEPLAGNHRRPGKKAVLTLSGGKGQGMLHQGPEASGVHRLGQQWNTHLLQLFTQLG